jgi:hypothetical protein
MSDSPTSTLPQRLLVMRIIHAALCMGVVTATAVLAVLRQSSNQPPPPAPVISWFGIGFAAVAIVLSFVMPRIVVSNWLRQWVATHGPETTGADDEAPLWTTYQASLIVGMALLEGAALFQAIAYLSEGQPISLGTVAILLLIMLTRWPTRTGIENWISAQREQIMRMRQDR